MKINEKGFWENKTSEGHMHDRRLALAIAAMLQKEKLQNLVDFGCGMNYYTEHFRQAGIICQAYDGNPNTYALTLGTARTQDLSVEFDLGEKFDCVMSLEVGEHIPAEFESIYLDNVCKHANGLIILSWAVPGQDGAGHVNCQTNEHIIDEMHLRSFTLDKVATKAFRNSSTLWWFKNTIMVFR
jgi:cyclopropane fatty-acyl-phospholipid synthase-like methyltransferase